MQQKEVYELMDSLDIRNWSFADRCLHEVAAIKYKEIINKVKRGTLRFNDVFLMSNCKAISLHGVDVLPYINSITFKHNQISVTFPLQISDQLIVNPNHELIWQFLKPRKTILWVKVKLPWGNVRWYQLPKDLQIAMRQHIKTHRHNWWKVLIGSYINVPISKYTNGNVNLSVGQIKYIKITHHSTGNPKLITRSQFIKPKEGKNNYQYLTTNQLRFLKHNFNLSNRIFITLGSKVLLFESNIRAAVYNPPLWIALGAILLLVVGTFFLGR